MEKNRIFRRVWKQVLLFIAVIALFTGFSQPVYALTITIVQKEGGTITASHESAKAGEAVTITVRTESGKGLKDNTLKVNEKVLNKKYNPSGKYTFTMPAKNVAVSAEYDDIILLKNGKRIGHKCGLDILKFIYGAKSEYASQIPSWENCGSACQDDSDKAFVYLDGKKAYLLTDDVGLTRANPNSSSMFYEFLDLTSADLTSFDTSMVTNMSSMFYCCSSLTSIDITNFDTSHVTDMSQLFCGCNTIKSLDVSSFDTSNVTNMYCMFASCDNLKNIDLSNLNTSKVTNMREMFRDNSFTSLDLSNFDTRNVINMSSMFSGSNILTSLDLSNFDTRNVKDLTYMFRDCKELTTIYASNKFVTTKKEGKYSFAFRNCYKLKAKRYGGSGEYAFNEFEPMFDETICIATTDVNGFFTDIRLKP